ncbi:alpha/beta hydrolase [Photorhabdus luminescens]|nr:alpha/beta hydrolase [Photorhabdus luminescens]
MANSIVHLDNESQWTGAFEDKSEEAFAGCLAADVILEAATLIQPVIGREKVKIIMGTASKIYTNLLFTTRECIGGNEWLRWEAELPGGMELKGVTVLTRNGEGLIFRIGIYHSPLYGVLAFSREMSKRTTNLIGPGYFVSI